MSLSRRQWLEICGGALAAPSLPVQAAAPAPADDVPTALAALRPMTDGVAPISTDEHRQRIVRAQKLLRENGLDALVLASGTSLTYFTGARWGQSERLFAAVITREGEPCWVTPGFERQRALEQIRVGSDVRAWEEDESPYALVAGILRDRAAASGRVGIEETVPFVFADGIGQAVPAARLSSGTPVTAGCRVVKDAHEVALMRRANLITVAAHRAVFASLREGMTQAEASRLSVEAHRRLGMTGGALVLFGPDAAFPHGTAKPRPLARGDVVLIDGGGRLHGYASDITRTAVFGAAPTDRQRAIWNAVRRAQQAAFEAARPGMCFSDEPGIYVPGELGVRHEDILVVTDTGADNMTKWTGPPEDPAIV